MGSGSVREIILYRKKMGVLYKPVNNPCNISHILTSRSLKKLHRNFITCSQWRWRVRIGRGMKFSTHFFSRRHSVKIYHLRWRRCPPSSTTFGCSHGRTNQQGKFCLMRVHTRKIRVGTNASRNVMHKFPNQKGFSRCVTTNRFRKFVPELNL